MTIAATGPTYVQLPGNGSATVFAFPFKIFQATDLVVGFITGGAYLPQASGFTVQGVDNNGGGTLTFSTPPAIGTTVDIRTVTPATQSTEVANLGRFLPEIHTEAFDRLTRMMQDAYRQTYLFGIHGPDTEGTPWTALPGAAQRAGLLLVFDGAGQPALLPPSTASGPGFSQLVVGPPAGGGSALTVLSSSGWGAITAESTIQVTGPNSLTNVNQNVGTTQLLLHGYAAEFVSINGSAGTDKKVWSNFADSSGNYNFRIENDALNATFTYLQVARSGNSGTFGSHQPILTFNVGYGTVTIASTISPGTYQLALYGGNVSAFSNGLHIGAGTGTSDNALTVVNAANNAVFFNIQGDGKIVMGPSTTANQITLTVSGQASSTGPVATFGGAASNFMTLTDGAGMTIVQQVATGNAGIMGTSSNHGLNLITNNTARITISASGGIGFFGGAATAKPTVTGSKGANAALTSLMTALSSLGLVTDSTT